MGSFHLCSLYLAWFSLGQWLGSSITHPSTLLRGMCVPAITCGLGKFSDFTMCTRLKSGLERPRDATSTTRWWQRTQKERRRTANSEKNVKDPQKVSFSIFLGLKTLPCMHTCVQAYKGCLRPLFPFKLIAGDMIWVLILDKCLSTSWDTRRHYRGSFPVKEQQYCGSSAAAPLTHQQQRGCS